MKQIIIDFGTFQLLGRTFSPRVYGYGLMLVLGFLAGVSLARWRARRAGENPEVVTACGLLAMLGGILGARIAYVIQHWHGQFAGEENPLWAVLNLTSGGLIYYGGAVLAVVAVLGYLFVRRLPVRRYLDIIAVSLMVGLAFGRVGCLLNGCCYGARCEPTWAMAMRFPMFPKPLLKIGRRDNPYPDGPVEPCPVYADQFYAGLVRPDDRLMGQIGSEWIHQPRFLHGPLDRDQVEVVLDEPGWQAAFAATAGADGQIELTEWQQARRLGRGILRGSEAWDEAILFDVGGDGRLGFPEAAAYMRHRREWLLARFDVDQDGSLLERTRSRPVKPAQALGIANGLVLAGILTVFYRIRRREGQVFALLLILYPLTRFVLESIRDQNAHDLSRGVLTHNQISSIVMAATGLLLWAGLRRLPPSAGPTWAGRIEEFRTLRTGRRKKK